MRGRQDPFEKRFLEFYSVVADAPSLDQSLQRLAIHLRDRLGATRVQTMTDVDPPSSADDILSLAEPGAHIPWMHLAISWGRRRRPEDSTLRTLRGSLALLMPFLAQQRRLDRAAQYLGEPSVCRLARPENGLPEEELKRLLHKLVERAVREAMGTHGAILLREPERDELKLEPSAYVGPLVLDPKTLPRILRRRRLARRAPVPDRRRNPSSSGLFFRVLDTRRPYRSGSVLDDPNYLPLFRDSRSNLTVPLLLCGTAIGAMVVESTQPDAFTAAHEQRLRNFAETVAALIAKARIYEETQASGVEHTLRLFGFSVDVLARAHKAASSNAPLLVKGETGTGKEMLARYIHRMSSATGTFRVVSDSAAVREFAPETTIGGTLFVDNIDFMPPAVQEHLAHLILSAPDVRFIVASCGGVLTDTLHAAVGANEISLPPLRMRPDAVPTLARLFLREVCEEHGSPVKLIAAPTIDVLLRYPYPANLRELREVIETAAAAADGPVVHPFHLPPHVLGKTEAGRARTFRAMKDATERAYLAGLISRTNGELTRAAKISGLQRSKLVRLLRKHKINLRHN